MFLHPPTRAMTKYVDGKTEASPPRMGAVTPANLDKFVGMYRRVSERCNRECEECGKPYLAAPHLRLAVLDPDGNLFSSRNIKMLCTTCNSAREESLRLTAADVTGITQAKVLERELNMCVYCDSGELPKKQVTVVSRVDRPDRDNVNDWACSCKACAKDRAGMSHDKYVSLCADRAFELWSRLRAMLE